MDIKITLSDVCDELYRRQQKRNGELFSRQTKQQKKNFLSKNIKYLKEIFKAMQITDYMKYIKPNFQMEENGYEFSCKSQTFLVDLLDKYTDNNVLELRRGHLYKVSDRCIVWSVEGLYKMFKYNGVPEDVLNQIGIVMSNYTDYPVRLRYSKMFQMTYDLEQLASRPFLPKWMTNLNGEDNCLWLDAMQEDLKLFIQKWRYIYEDMGECRQEEVNKLAEEGYAKMTQNQIKRAEIEFELAIELSNAYTGALVQGKTSRIRVGGSETRRTKKHQQFITENHHKGIVTHEEFELAQLVIGNQKQKGFARDAGFSLKGKVKCGNCGLKMMYNYGAMPVVYCGHTAAVGSMSTCDKTRYSAAKIERIVLVALRKQLEIFQSMAKILEEGEEKNKTNLPAMQRNMEQELEKLKAERIRQYEAYAEGVVNQETYLKNKKDLNEKIEIIQDKYEQIQEVTSVEDNLMKDIRIVEKNAEEVNILKKMTRHIAETFVEEITIYDSEKIEIRFVFDDLLIGMADRIKKKTEDIA